MSAVTIDGQTFQTYSEAVNAYQEKAQEVISQLKTKLEEANKTLEEEGEDPVIETEELQKLVEGLPQIPPPPTPSSQTAPATNDNVPVNSSIPIQGGNAILPGGTVIEPPKIIPPSGTVAANPVPEPTPVPYAPTPE